MIHYQLRCENGHGFDGWFRDSAAFEKQVSAGFVECPSCASTKVDRALMAPAIPKKGRPARNAAPEAPPEPPKPEAQPAPPAPLPTPVMAARMPAELRAALARLRAEVEKNCDYVGPAFAEEARRMHRGESERRGIYGETSPEEAEALREEGVEFASVPWVPPTDA
ncbi:MAG: DUF1178 family protein [Acetobacteraceae bacterium]